MIKVYLKKLKMEFVIAGAVLIALSCILFIRPIIGVADNGDFARIMNSTGLYYLTQEPSDRYFGFVNRLYGCGFLIPFGGGYISTQLPLVLSAISVSKQVLGEALFDIRFLAAIYILIFAAAVFLIARSGRKIAGFLGLIPAAAFIFIFCDIGYTSYFNSLYGEPVTLVFLLLMAGAAMTLAVAEKPAIWTLVLFCASAIFFTGAKVQNTPAGLLAAVLCIRLATRFRKDATHFGQDAAWRSISIVSAVLVLAATVVCSVSVSKDIKICNKYQTVFYGILRDAPDPAGDLEELGLDPSLAVLAGTNYFMEDYPVDIKAAEFKKMLFEKISYTNVAAFYIRHPARLLQKLEYAAENGFRLRQGFGNYEKYPGIQYKQTSDVFGLWSSFKTHVLPNTLSFVFVFFAGSLLALLYEYKMAGNKVKTRFLIEFTGFVWLTGVMQFVLPVIGDGDADLSKHLFLFNVCFDLLFAAGLSYLAFKVTSMIRHCMDLFRRLSGNEVQ